MTTEQRNVPVRSDTQAPVLVVGGGLVGLSSALFLAWLGVDTVLVEKHPGSSPHPRAVGYTPRTLELLRAVGLGAQVPQAPAGFRLRRVKVESLTGKWHDDLPSWAPEKPPSAQSIEHSPCRGAAMAQDRMEHLLRARAIELGADIRLATELIRFEQDENGVTTWLRERDTGKDYTLRASYMIAADGHRSPVREALGIGRSGRGHMRTVRSVLFRAQMDEYLRDGVKQFSIAQPDLEAFLVTYNDGRWALMFEDDEERNTEQLKATIFKAIGRTDVEIELITTGRWDMSALIADSFQSGRVFLAGDAAHTLPPNRGGYGANTGIEDAHNLAWKLSSVLSTPQLLNTYDAERRPIAWLRHDQIFARPDYKAYASPTAKQVPILEDEAMEFGQLYRSTAVLGASDDLPAAQRPDEWAGQPGTRASHSWIHLPNSNDRISTLDLFQRSWILIAGDESWRQATVEASERLGIKVECRHIGIDFTPTDETLSSAFGIGTGASLIRPDGYIAWRTNDIPSDPRAALTEALACVSSASLHSA